MQDRYHYLAYIIVSPRLLRTELEHFQKMFNLLFALKFN